MKYIQLNEDIKTKAQIEKFLYKELNDYFVVNQKEINIIIQELNFKIRHLISDIKLRENNLRSTYFSPAVKEKEQLKLQQKKEALDINIEKQIIKYSKLIKSKYKNSYGKTNKKNFTLSNTEIILKNFSQELAIYPILYNEMDGFAFIFAAKTNENYLDLNTGEILVSNIFEELSDPFIIKKDVFDKYNSQVDSSKKKTKSQTKTEIDLSKLSQNERIIYELNDAQKSAATYKNENLLILAGAGCGKTKTIIARAAYLISQGYSPDRIKILTFTKKAAFEITQRVDNLLDSNSYGLGASTFHRWCIDLIKNTPEVFGFKGFSIIDRDDQFQIFKKLRGKPKKGELPKSAELCDTYSFARNTRNSLSKAIVQVIPLFREKKDEIANIMKGYETEKQVHNYFDYDDILDIIAKAVSENEDVCKWIAGKYDCILVDEMQDTNPLQWAILEPLSHYTKLFCVGDDAQSIYGFRGADFKNVHSFSQRIENSTVLKLEDNYRSTQEILDVSNWLLSKSVLDYNKKLNAVRGKGKLPEIHTFNNNFDEARWIISDLKEKYDSDELWNNKMILVRSGYSGRNIETELLRNKIPYIFIGGQKLMEAAHIKDLMSVLRVVSNNKDEIAWIRFLTLFPGVGPVTAERFTAKLVQHSTIEGCLDILKTASYSGSTLNHLFEQLYKSTDNIPAMIDRALIFMDDLLQSKYGKTEWEYRKKDFDFLKQLAEKFDSISEFIEEYLLDPVFVSQQDKRKNENCVVLSTIHSAKGSENEIVYVTNISVGKSPSLRDLSADGDKEEERRVLYVALTRARDELIITRNTELDFWMYEDDIRKLKANYFLKGLPTKLAKEVIHRESTYSGSYTQKHFYGEPKVKATSPKSKLTFNSSAEKKSSISTKRETQPITIDKTGNPKVVEFMKTHKKGEIYPEEIKKAVVSEYIPKVNGYVKIGKKYGINADMIKDWVRLYR